MNSVVFLCALFFTYVKSHKLTECGGGGYYRCSGYDPWLANYVYSKCIREDLICNGIRNCYYGEDEEDCGDDSASTTHTPEKVFKDTFTTERTITASQSKTFASIESSTSNFATTKNYIIQSTELITFKNQAKNENTSLSNDISKSTTETLDNFQLNSTTHTPEKFFNDTHTTEGTTKASESQTSASIESSTSNFETTINDIIQSTESITFQNEAKNGNTLSDDISKSTTEIHDNLQSTSTIIWNTTESTVTDLPEIDDCIHLNGLLYCNGPLIISIIASILVSLALVLCVLIHWKIKRRRKQNKLSAAQRFRMIHRRYDN